MSDRWMHAVALFNLHIAGRPLWLLVAFYAALRGWQAVGARIDRRPGPSRPLASRGSMALALATLALYAGVVLWYAVQPIYVDYAEPTMAAVAWLAHVGQPIYPAPTAAERYAHMYGPLAFLIPSWPMAILGAGIPASKVAGIVAGLLSPAVCWAIARRVTDRRGSALVAALAAALALAFGPIAFWIRPDAFLLLFAAVALWCATDRRRGLAVAGVGLAAGILVDLKLTGPLYALPAVALLASRFGAAALAACAAVGAVAAALPFLLVAPGSFVNYRYWVALSAANGLEFRTLQPNLDWAAFLLAPLAACVLIPRPAAWPRRDVVALTSGLALGVVGVVIAASKPGAGPYHLLPFIPTIALVVALYRDGLGDRLRRDPTVRGAAIAFGLALAIAVAGRQAYFVGEASRIDAGAADEIAALIRARPDARIALGYGTQEESATFARPVPVFAGHPYLLDMPAIQEHQMSGIELPPATVAAIESCRVTLWLIPRHGEPFAMKNGYPRTGYRPLFTPYFVAAFERRYRKTGETARYDLWECQPHGDR